MVAYEDYLKLLTNGLLRGICPGLKTGHANLRPKPSARCITTVTCCRIWCICLTTLFVFRAPYAAGDTSPLAHSSSSGRTGLLYSSSPIKQVRERSAAAWRSQQQESAAADSDLLTADRQAG